MKKDYYELFNNGLMEVKQLNQNWIAYIPIEAAKIGQKTRKEECQDDVSLNSPRNKCNIVHCVWNNCVNSRSKMKNKNLHDLCEAEEEEVLVGTGSIWLLQK